MSTFYSMENIILSEIWTQCIKQLDCHNINAIEIQCDNIQTMQSIVILTAARNDIFF